MTIARQRFLPLLQQGLVDTLDSVCLDPNIGGVAAVAQRIKVAMSEVSNHGRAAREQNRTKLSAAECRRTQDVLFAAAVAGPGADAKVQRFLFGLHEPKFNPGSTRSGARRQASGSQKRRFRRAAAARRNKPQWWHIRDKRHDAYVHNCAIRAVREDRIFWVCAVRSALTHFHIIGSRAVVGWGHAGVTLPRLVTNTHWEWIAILPYICSTLALCDTLVQYVYGCLHLYNMFMTITDLLKNYYLSVPHSTALG
jgi:hypothetical protein